MQSTWQTINVQNKRHNKHGYSGSRSGRVGGDDRLEINRIWAMPNKWTFRIKPIKELINRYVKTGYGTTWVDPFAGYNSPAHITNDIEGRGNKFNLDGLEFLKTIDNGLACGCLFDPPYSVDQSLRKYTPKFKGTAGRAEYRAKCKDEIGRIIKKGGIVISFSWDSAGIGLKRGFDIIEILLICHGACHNDTIVTVERKIKSNEEIPFP